MLKALFKDRHPKPVWFSASTLSSRAYDHQGLVSSSTASLKTCSRLPLVSWALPADLTSGFPHHDATELILPPPPPTPAASSPEVNIPKDEHHQTMQMQILDSARFDGRASMVSCTSRLTENIIDILHFFVRRDCLDARTVTRDYSLPTFVQGSCG